MVMDWLAFHREKKGKKKRDLRKKGKGGGF